MKKIYKLMLKNESQPQVIQEDNEPYVIPLTVSENVMIEPLHQKQIKIRPKNAQDCDDDLYLSTGMRFKKAHFGKKKELVK